MKNRRSGVWRFSYSVLLPMFIAGIATLSTVGMFALWATIKNDAEALERQQTLIAHVLDGQRRMTVAEQEDVVAWQAAEEAMLNGPDLEFIDQNLGSGLQDFHGHDRTYVIAPNLKAIYAMRDGVVVSPDAYLETKDILEPHVRRLREIDWQGALTAFGNGGSETIPHLDDLIVIEGQPAIVSLMPVVSDRGNSELAPGGEYIHITAQFLDGIMAKSLAEMVMLDGARFSTNATPLKGESSVTLRNNAGDPVAYFYWIPVRPGTQLVEDTAPALIGATIIAAAIIAVLIMQLRRSTTALIKSRAEADHKAHHDGLTGLGNRTKFEVSLEDAIARLHPYEAGSVALLLLDLDRFKQVNDTLGHEAGDELIRQVGDRLRPLIRATDTIARLGGDEFVVIAEKCGSEEEIRGLCTRIVENIRKPFELSTGQAFVGVSIGVAVAESRHTNASELTRMADIALYSAKDGGRDQYKIFTEEMQDLVRERQAIEADLRAALLTDDQLDVHFSPLVRDNGAEVVGVSARIRWRHPERGEVPRSVYIPIAETCGLIDTISEFVLHRACEVGAKSRGQIVSVRAYPAQLRNPFFFDKVFDILHKAGMRAEDLELEISEKMLSRTEEAAAETMLKLQNAGINIAINNFGEGFTSLRLLQNFKVNRVKFDSDFLAELRNSPDPEAITHAMVWLARAIGVEVSADGIDTREQMEFLSRMGIGTFQGELFSPEGQAEWLRIASNLEISASRHTLKKSDPEAEPDVELWESAI